MKVDSVSSYSIIFTLGRIILVCNSYICMYRVSLLGKLLYIRYNNINFLPLF